VDVSNNTQIENGSLEHPFNTIEEGLAVAQNRDTIMVAGGTYTSNSILIPKCVTIIGKDFDSTIVEGQFVLSSLLDTIPVTITQLKCQNVLCSDSGSTKTPLVINQCRLQSFYDTTASVDSTGSILFKDNIFEDSIHIQNISCRGSRVILNNSIGGNLWFSSLVLKNNSFRIESNHIGRNLFLSTVVNADTIVIAENEVQDSLVIHSVSTQPNLVTGNSIGKGMRIVAISSKGNQIHNNQLAQGILKCAFVASHELSIQNNDFLNGGIDISCRTTDAVISNNTIHSDGTVTGIKLQSVSGGSIAGNVITLPYLPPTGVPAVNDTNAICAIFVNSVSFDGLSNNDLQGGAYGIYMKGVANSYISNSVIQNSHVGIYLSTVSCRVDSNIVKNCIGDGIILSLYPGWGDTSSIHMKSNSITNNGGHGIRVTSYATLGISGDPSIGFNSIKDNTGYDLYIETPVSLIDTIFAQNNSWSHTSESEIGELDIYDGIDNNTLAVVAFSPFNIFGINDGKNTKVQLLDQNYPNPFAQSTTISWETSTYGHVVLKVFDFFGREIRTLLDEKQAPGEHQVTFKADGLPAGIYFYQIKAGSEFETKKMVICK